MFKTVEIERYQPRVSKHEFFSRPTVAEIKEDRDQKTATRNLVETIEQIDPNREYVVITLDHNGLIPVEWYPQVDGQPDVEGGRTFASRAFLKHGQAVTLETTLQEIDRLRKMPRINEVNQALHVAFRQRAYDAKAQEFNQRRQNGKTQSSDWTFSGYQFRPIKDDANGNLVIGANNETRHVLLTECVNAAMMLWYWRHSSAKVDVDVIDMHQWKGQRALYKAIQRVGLRATAVVPSRTKKKPRYVIAIDCIPIINSDFQLVIPWSIDTTHDCKRPHYDRGYETELYQQTHNRVYVDAHVIFAYYALTTHFLVASEGRERVMRWNSPFALPTEDQMEFNWRLRNRVLIEALNTSGETTLYPLNQAEQEILTGARVLLRRHDPTFFPTKPIYNYEFGTYRKAL